MSNETLRVSKTLRVCCIAYLDGLQAKVGRKSRVDLAGRNTEIRLWIDQLSRV